MSKPDLSSIVNEVVIPKHAIELSPSIEELIVSARNNFESGHEYMAAAFYRAVLTRTKPYKTGLERIAHGEACRYFALKCAYHAKLGEAGDWYREALDADPRATDYRIEFVIKVLKPMGLTEAAHQEITRAVKIDPTDARAWRTLGGLEYELGNTKESKHAYEKAFELAPDIPSSYLDLACIELDTANYTRVEELCKIIEEKFPEHIPDVHHCRAMVAYRENKFNEAIELYTKAVEGNCSNSETARWNRSLPLQAIGRYKEGWVDAEARGDQKTSVEFGIALRRFKAPLFELDKHKPPAQLHLHEEMGFGDTFAMLRYLPLLISRGYDVRVEVRDSLVDLVKRSFPDVAVIERAPDYPGALTIPAFDYHHSLLSLPYVFGTEVDTIPWKGPYLKADPELVKQWQKYLPPKYNTGFKDVGIAWSAGVRKGVWLTEYGQRKSLHFSDLNRLVSGQEAGFYRLISLQCGPEADQNDKIRYGVTAVGNPPNWDQTAALIECLDLVITPDTAIAHLAGAMGKPVWVMWAESAASWHFMADIEGAPWQQASPWYPTACVYRQEKGRPHYWVDVVSKIYNDLILLK